MKTIFVLPLSAALMLGTAAYAQTAGQPMNDTMTQPGGQPSAQPAQSTQMNEQPGAGDQNSGMSNATMYGSSAGQMDPKQSAMGGMPIDEETTVGGIQAACTGVGDAQEDRAKWSDYPVKLVVSGTNHQFFAGETVSVSKSDGTQVAQMTCNGPWVLMKLDPGSYHATVDLPGHETKTVAFTAPSRGQREVNVVYTGAQETSDETSAGANQYRATPTGYQQPNAAPPPVSQPTDQNNNTATPQNGPQPNTNENYNLDQNPQTPQ